MTVPTFVKDATFALLGTALVFLVAHCQTASAQEIAYTESDVYAAVDEAPAVVSCITWHESGFNPYAVGYSGEQGPIQLLPSWLGGGQWNEYLYGDWTDMAPQFRSVNDPYLTTAYLIYWGETHGWTFEPWHVWPRYCA